MRNIFLILLVFQSLSYSQDISLDDLLNIRSIPEFKLLAFENSFVLNKLNKTEQVLKKTDYYYKPNYNINQNKREYVGDYKMKLTFEVITFEDICVEYHRPTLTLNNENFAAENSILRESILKSIKSKCKVEKIFYWGKNKRFSTTDINNSNGEIASVYYNCENNFGDEVNVNVEIDDYNSRFYFLNKNISEFIIINKEIPPCLD